MDKMLVIKALNELKLLDKRINRKIDEGEFIASARVSANNVSGKISKDSFMKNAKAEYASIKDLIQRRNRIKSAIIYSNAITKLTVANVEMSVAEAIDKKSAIAYEKALLDNLSFQYNASLQVVQRENAKVDASIEQLLNTAYGKEGKEKITEESHKAIAEPYKKANEFGLVDGLDIGMVIKALKEDIERFESDIDTALQISNSITSIEID